MQSGNELADTTWRQGGGCLLEKWLNDIVFAISAIRS